MDCREAREGMSLALDGTLSGEEGQALQGHRSGCSACQAYWEALQALSSALWESPLASPRNDLVLRLEAHRQRERSRRRWMAGLVAGGLWVGLALAGLVGASAGLGWCMLQQATLVGTVMVVLARGLLLAEATARALWVLAGSLPGEGVWVGIGGWSVVVGIFVWLWAGLVLRPRRGMSVG